MRRALVALAVVSVSGLASADPKIDAIEWEFLEIINEYRASFGLPCLSLSPTMNVAADWFSREMGEKGFFSHNEPPCDENGENCTGRDPFDRIVYFGHTGWTTAGENIAAGYVTAEAVFEAWRNSPGHDENMREPGFTAIGIGRVEVPGSVYRVYWTNDFSNNPDGDHDCNDPGSGGSGGGSEGGSGGGGGEGGSGGGGEGGSGGSGEGGTGGGVGEGGTGGDAGEGGTGGEPAEGGAGGESGEGGRGAETGGPAPDDGGGSGDGGGCATAAGTAAPGAIALALLAALRRRRTS